MEKKLDDITIETVENGLLVTASYVSRKAGEKDWDDHYSSDKFVFSDTEELLNKIREVLV